MQNLVEDRRAGPFKDIKQLQRGKEQSVLPACGRQDIKWAEVIAEENQVKHHKKQSEQGGRHSSAGVEVPGPGAGAGRDGRAAPSPPRPTAIHLRSRGHLWASAWALGSAPLSAWARLPVPPPSPLICPHFTPVTTCLVLELGQGPRLAQGAAGDHRRILLPMGGDGGLQ